MGVVCVSKKKQSLKAQQNAGRGLSLSVKD
jgi:hypothetical protein